MEIPPPKTDYHKRLVSVLDSVAEESRLSGKKPDLLLHACCAPCSSYVIEYLSEFFNITIYYYNPNIHPESEYRRRAGELADFLPRFLPAVKNKIRLVEAEYNPQEFFDATNARNETALQTEPERGERCRRCYELRIRKSFEYAAENDFDWFATTLSISPHKDAEKINQIGYTLDKVKDIKWLPADFKKNNGFLRSRNLSREYGLYRQDYCGCVYSMRGDENRGEA